MDVPDITAIRMMAARAARELSRHPSDEPIAGEMILRHGGFPLLGDEAVSPLTVKAYQLAKLSYRELVKDELLSLCGRHLYVEGHDWWVSETSDTSSVLTQQVSEKVIRKVRKAKKRIISAGIHFEMEDRQRATDDLRALGFLETAAKMASEKMFTEDEVEDVHPDSVLHRL